MQGSTEVAPALGFSDFVCDLVQSGRTLEDNNLKPILTIMNSQAILVESPVQQNFINNPLIK
jgi:ATP phosphoribosyltransferase